MGSQGSASSQSGQVPKLSRIQSTDRVMNQLQDQLHQTVNSIVNHPETHSLVLKNVQLKAGSNDISHGLGRELQGWRVIRQRSQGSVFDQQDSNVTPHKTLSLNASHDMSVDLLVH
jgi:hypothetical protein